MLSHAPRPVCSKSIPRFESGRKLLQFLSRYARRSVTSSFLAGVCGKALSCTQERPEPFFILPPDGALHVIHELARCKIQAFLALLVHMVSVPEMLMATGHAKDPDEKLGSS